MTLKEISTPLGVMIAGATSKGICMLEYPSRKQRVLAKLSYKIEQFDSHFIKLLEIQLQEYFHKQRKTFDIPLDIQGTIFQKKVWNALLAIPYGSTISYQEQAQNINQPKATRAVANANGANKISILIPCHRVIGKNGNLRGYGGGLENKKFLLNLEN